MSATADELHDLPDGFGAVHPSPSIPWETLEPAADIEDVVRNLDQVIDWAIRAESTIGYFAVLYKQTTLSLRAEIDKGANSKFQNRALMAQFVVLFASRYFNALNAYFNSDGRPSDGLTLPWEVAFVGEELGYSTMLQHMIAGFNAHITFDLGMVTVQMVPKELDTFEQDFNVVNAILASQIHSMLNSVEKLSPNVVWIRRAIPREVRFIRKLLVKFRQSAWWFAIFMAEHPDKARQKRVDQTSWTSALSAWYLHPPEYGKLLPRVIRFISKREIRDTAANLRELNVSASQPAPLNEKYL